ncbi:hypothetical protein G7074_15145 [Pedobacter sp. HDW13]|uniref:hypothetical protein n=1 Tax=Pedobacter sp. HDW13 TaxID=2714940 RepID=UPI00140BAB0E|nr:hypothetical protein [Pedobacter sp. HDW13]QIL40480.1 hypothetical protein G7074_15145 [Pedobacter sp. HDW13]
MKISKTKNSKDKEGFVFALSNGIAGDLAKSITGHQAKTYVTPRNLKAVNI